MNNKTSKLDNIISTNINALINQHYSEGKTKASVSKIIDYIKNSFNIEIDNYKVEDILSSNNIVNSVIDDEIVLGAPKPEGEDNVNDEIHDNAVNQIDDHIKFESVADVIGYLKPGMMFKSSRVRLTENDDHYHLHISSVKNKCQYVVSEILPNTTLNESLVKCKIDGTAFFVNIPVKYFLK
jgi:hypothetical protein